MAHEELGPGSRVSSAGRGPGGRRVFLLEDYLAHGSFGAVYTAREARTGTPAVVKVEKRGVEVSGQHMREQLVIEAEVYHRLAGLPGVPTSLGGAVTPTHNFLVLRRLHWSATGLARAAPGGRMSPASAVALAHSALGVLRGMHDAGLVHRDIKPDNIMLDVSEPRQAYLVDYGMARQWGEPRPGSGAPLWDTAAWVHAPDEEAPLTGTAEYVSAHVTAGHRGTRRDDVVALAHACIKLVLGALPWTPPPAGGADPHGAWRAGVASERRADGVPDAPPALAELARQGHALAYDERPPYGALQALLLHLAGVGAPEDLPLDWEPLVPPAYRGDPAKRRPPPGRPVGGLDGGPPVHLPPGMPIAVPATPAALSAVAYEQLPPPPLRAARADAAAAGGSAAGDGSPWSAASGED